MFSVWGIKSGKKWQGNHYEFSDRFDPRLSYTTKADADRNIKAFVAWLSHEKTAADPKWKDHLQNWKNAVSREIKLTEVES